MQDSCAMAQEIVACMYSACSGAGAFEPMFHMVMLAGLKQGPAIANRCAMLCLQGAAMAPRAAWPEAQPDHLHQHQQQERAAKQARHAEQVGCRLNREAGSTTICLTGAWQLHISIEPIEAFAPGFKRELQGEPSYFTFVHVELRQLPSAYKQWPAAGSAHQQQQRHSLHHAPKGSDALSSWFCS